MYVNSNMVIYTCADVNVHVQIDRSANKKIYRYSSSLISNSYTSTYLFMYLSVYIFPVDRGT